MTWKNSISMNIGRSYCPDVNNLVIESNDKPASPIDAFYSSTNEILTKIDPVYFSTYSENITGLLLVGLISATENYFRDILGSILTICPTSQAHAADEKIQLGSMLWSQNDMHNRSAFEFMAFSSGENINKTMKNFTSYQIKTKGNWDAMLGEYDKLCELRHAIVHSGHIVAGKNAIKLGLKRNKQTLKVKFTYASLQDAGKVCTALIQAANNELFELLIERWAGDWRKLPSWDVAREVTLLKDIRDTFISKRDSDNKAIVNSRSQKELLTQLRAAFNL